MAIRGKSELMIVWDQFLVSWCLYCKANCTLTETVLGGPPTSGFKTFSLGLGKGLMLGMSYLYYKYLYYSAWVMLLVTLIQGCFSFSTEYWHRRTIDQMWCDKVCVMCGEQSYQGMESKQLSPPAAGDSGHHAGTDIAMTTAFVVRLSRGCSARKQHQVPLWDGPLEVWPHGKPCCLVLFSGGIPLLLASAGTLRLLHTYDMFILCCFMLYTSPCFCNNEMRVLILCLMSGAANDGAELLVLQGSSALGVGHRLCAETQSRCSPSSGGKCILLYQPFARWCLRKQYLEIFETSWGKPCSVHHNS